MTWNWQVLYHLLLWGLPVWYVSRFFGRGILSRLPRIFFQLCNSNLKFNIFSITPDIFNIMSSIFRQQYLF
ncbi:hypothetical protein GLOIN_2v1642614 [Rhizophagus irregularis DAOM 181602=DAOM 197198]|uniref:Uncharacterized protein n=1 Tax=Rhizophagus irregularis (strain DAOM 181602 / DAOM 197198 / MUCL 43194) TaxID=747089 RepID=A0A2P4PRE8_RHIID|nr:hypothetical protein GLOIN_2v1642614 [Rhizophagus irregularis DAOM 181602=DAOM 197198]POG67930.1 hypothetical protein GLOIN_2v1642614 [Rhizophagus irregularis DAOM 181602=DAOM 197198]|eukprot:XP_025174796.1 hypothetical protein GLOIN_2v1642614 [Rhizophagus irregularis DAOM 181602=DAOM 197198]